MKSISILLVAFVTFSLGFLAGGKVKSSHEKINNYSQVEYASETDNKFYQKMIELKRNQTLHFDGFPTSLTSILFKNLQPGERILNCGDEPLTLVFEDLDRSNINKYYYYIIKDTKNNYWSLYRHNDKFRLSRIDEKRNKEWLKKLEDQIKTN